jgi:hypothetical protein
MARIEPRERSLVLVRPRGRRLPVGWATETRNGTEVAVWMAIKYDPAAADEGEDGIRGTTAITAAFLWDADSTVPEECADDVIREWEATFAQDIPAGSWEYLVLLGAMMGSMRGRGFRGVPVPPWLTDRPHQPSSTNDTRGGPDMGSERVGRGRGRGNGGAARPRARASSRAATAAARSGRSRRR